MEIKEQVRTFVRSNFYVPPAVVIADKASLLEQGIIDSTGVLELISFIEDTFGVSIDESEMIPQNFESVEAISSFVSRKKS